MSQPSQADVFAALQAQSSSLHSRSTPKTSLLSDHDDPESALTMAVRGAYPVNGTNLYCWRKGCGSLLLLPQVALWTVGEGDVIPSDPKSPFPPSSDSTAFWYVDGSPMAFENIGLSRASKTILPAHTPGLADAAGDIKFLICAECDMGPIGWSFEGGTKAWLAAERVRYGPSQVSTTTDHA